MTAVKICGITSLDDALNAIKYGASYLGFIFARESPRYIEPDKARNIIDGLRIGDGLSTGDCLGSGDCLGTGDGLSPACKTVAVFKNEPEESLAQIVATLKPDLIQLHGEESLQYCRRRSHAIIKTIEIKDDMSAQSLSAQIDRYRAVSQFLLFDRPKNVACDLWLPGAIRMLTEQMNVPSFFFAGGLTADNVAFAVDALRPVAVDVASGVESTPGKKDIIKLKNFCDAVKNTEETKARLS